MDSETSTHEQRAGVLCVRLLGTPAKFKTEFLPLENTGRRPQADSQGFADDAGLESYLEPFMPFIPDGGSGIDLVRKVRLQGSVTRYICCTKLEWEDWLRQS
jgi:hypothetical protein